MARHFGFVVVSKNFGLGYGVLHNYSASFGNQHLLELVIASTEFN
jgi:hypothetical protein